MTTETKTKFTPGPWNASRVMGDEVVHGSQGDCIAWCNGIRIDNAANAQLIASSPKMLKALEKLNEIIDPTKEELAQFYTNDDWLAAMRGVREAIKEARGQ